MLRSAVLHPDTHLEPQQLGTVYHPYRKTIEFDGDLIDATHKTLKMSCERGMLKGVVPGSLREADALKLYELAYFADGPVLELGTFHGLSAFIIASAIKNSGGRHKFTSVDSHQRSSELGRTNLSGLGLGDFATFETSDGTAYLDRMVSSAQQFSFIFIDHSHAYQDVRHACERLPALMGVGSFVLFHDFNDPRNLDVQHPSMGVYQAVLDGLEGERFRFCGTYGCTALYRVSDPG